ncbi:beta-galactosidase BoGH2A [Abditibacteriota bacterium]|nr:beta-galactosidase BoGH2A [Abditibacteriota bacterium]
MKRHTVFTLASALALSLLSQIVPTNAATSQFGAPRERLNFNANWRFHKGPIDDRVQWSQWRWRSGNDLAALAENTSAADWKNAAPTEDVFKSERGFAWFRSTFTVSNVAPSVPLTLKFSGVDDNATIYLNGEKISSHEGWGVAFDVPLGQNWKPNQPNEIAVLVENGAGAGSLGNVELQIGTTTLPRVAETSFSDAAWRQLNLPHDWGIEGPFDPTLPGESGRLPWMGIGWYRKTFVLPASDAGRKIYLDIDGAMSYSTVYLNGQMIGGWPYGYSSYELDLTPYVKVGATNVLAVRLDNPDSSTRWYPGGGIYRNTWLVKTAPTHIAHWGVTVTTPDISKTAARVNVAVSLEKTNSTEPITVQTDIFECDSNGLKTGNRLARVQTTPTTAAQQELQLQLPNPKLWDTKTPHLYVAETSLLQKNQVIDTTSTRFGIRRIEWNATQGFLLNGEKVKLQGVCLHHTLGALGAAFNLRAQQRQLELLREMGCNAIRSAHNPPAPELLDLCDRMGMLVLDEFSDTWTRAKTPNGYARLFDEWSKKDVRAMVRRDRNHPSIILWMSGNEIPEQDDPNNGAKISGRLTQIFHEEDPTRPVSAAVSDARGGYNGFQKTLDVMGYNYKPWEYAKFRAANPNQPLFGSETSSVVSSRGEYFFPVTNDQYGGKSDFQVSSYDFSFEGWASGFDMEEREEDRNPFVAGEFVWSGFDYLGEPTPYNSDLTNILNYHTPEARAAAEKELRELGKIRVPSRSSYFGIFDLAGFRKDRFYLYQARWRPDFPMAHILPHWNWPDRIGQITPVFVYTSGDEAELFLNGQSLGRKKKGPYEYRLRWDDVKYQPGELEVVAYKNGRRWAEDAVKTTKAAAKIALRPDRTVITADGQDLSFITVSINDADNLLVPRAQNSLRFQISGPAEIVAIDNGDATDLTSFSSSQRKAYNGLALVIVRSQSGQKGTIRLRATSEGLISAETNLTSR